MIIIPVRYKWKRTFQEIQEYCVVRHVFGKWYLVRKLLKGSPQKEYRKFKHFIWRFVWYLVNIEDFPKEEIVNETD